MRSAVRFNKRKLKELVLYISAKSESDPNFGATKLNKLLFCADFVSYREIGKPITGCRYQKLSFGPAPRPLLPALKELEEEKACVLADRPRFSRRQRRVLARRKAKLELFSAEEIALVDELIEYFGAHNAAQVSEWSHDFVGWQLAEIGEDIPYQTALVADPRPLTRAEIEHGRKLGDGSISNRH